MNNRILLIINILLAGGLLTMLIMSFKGNGEEHFGGFTVPEQSVRTIDLNRPFDFCGESLPMDNFDVRQRLDRELAAAVYGHSATLLNIKRANSLFPVIEPILKEEGVPDDLKYLAVAESQLSNAVSPAGAKGVWQFIKSAGQGFGLEINDEVDERYHLEKSTRAACKYLRQQRDKQGSWILAAAAYNGGPERISTELGNQRANNFFEMNLTEETMRYPFRIVAIKEVMQNPERYEFQIEPAHLYPPLPPTTTVEVNYPVENWGDFALKYGTNYRMLKILNPWLLDNKLTNKARKTYYVSVPK